MTELNDKIFHLRDEGFTPSKIAQKLKVKKAVVNEILGSKASKGLGDIITEFTEVTGIKKVVEAVSDDCGCAARAAKLNKLFPNHKTSDLSNEDFKTLEEYFSKKLTSLSAKEQRKLVTVYNNVFGSKREVSSCSPCVRNLVRDLKKLYNGAR